MVKQIKYICNKFYSFFFLWSVIGLRKTSIKYLGEPCARMAPAQQDCLGNGQTKQNLAVQLHQLHKQVEALQVSCHLHPFL